LTYTHFESHLKKSSIVKKVGSLIDISYSELELVVRVAVTGQPHTGPGPCGRVLHYQHQLIHDDKLGVEVVLLAV